MILLLHMLPPLCLVDDGICLRKSTFVANFGTLKFRDSGCKPRPSRTWRRATATSRCFWQFDSDFLRLVQTLGDVMTVRATGFRDSPSSILTMGGVQRHKRRQHWRALTFPNCSATQTQSGVIFTSFIFETLFLCLINRFFHLCPASHSKHRSSASVCVRGTKSSKNLHRTCTACPPTSHEKVTYVMYVMYVCPWTVLQTTVC